MICETIQSDTPAHILECHDTNCEDSLMIDSTCGVPVHVAKLMPCEG